MTAGPQSLLVVLAGDSLEELLAHLRLQASQRAKLSPVAIVFLMSFTSLPKTWFSRKSQRWGCAWEESRAHRSIRPWFSGSSPEPGWILWIQGFTPFILGCICTSWERVQLHPFPGHLQGRLNAVAVLLSQFIEEVAQRFSTTLSQWK